MRPLYLFTPAAILVLLALSFAQPLPPAAEDPGLGHEQSGMFQPGDFTDPLTCGMCHPDQNAQFTGSMHEMAATDPFYHRVVQMAVADLPVIEPFCSSCHVPAGVLIGQPPLEPDNLDPAARAGVNCDFCHTVKAQTRLFNFGYVVSPGEVKTGSRGTIPPLFHTVEVSPLIGTAEYCGMCHNVNHPLNGLGLETTYSEFIAGPYPALGYKCQSCHMTPGVTEHRDNPGSLVNGGEVYDHTWTHHFAGANAWITEMMGAETQAALARDRLSRAAQVTISNAFPAPGGGSFGFTVIVDNVGCGHMLPTGVTEERQIWLEVVVQDRNGSELAHFGRLDEHGVIAEDTMILGTVFGDAEGRPTHKIWLAESVLHDRRIAPKEADMQAYEVALPAKAEVAQITAQLWYRSSHQDFVDVVFADTPERELVPSIPMASAAAEF